MLCYCIKRSPNLCCVQEGSPIPNLTNDGALPDERVKATKSWGTSKEELEQVRLGSAEKKVSIRVGMSAALRSEIISFLQENSNVFAWSHDDMPEIDPSVIVPKLNIDPDYKSVK